MLRFSIYIFLTLFLVGCIKDPAPQIESGEEDPYVVLTLNVPSSGSPKSYAINEFDENTISELDVLVFKKDTGGTERYQYRISIPKDSIDISSQNANGAIKNFRIRLQRTTDQIGLLVIANASASIAQYENDYGFQEGITSAEMIHDRLKFSAASWTGTLTSSGFKPFPMWGESQYFYVNTATPPSIKAIKMMRSVAKVVVTYDIKDQNGTPLGYDGTIINSVHLFRSQTQGNIAPYYSEGYNVENPNIPSTSTKSATPLSWSCNLYKDQADTEKVHRTFAGDIYLAETLATVEGSENQGTCVVLGIKKNSTSPELFYRIDFAENNQYVPVLRNHSYNIDIINVYHDGYTTAAAAAAGPSYSIVYDISISQDNINEILWNDHFMLGISSSEIEALLKVTSTSFEVYTTCSSGWEATVDNTLYPWLTIQSGNESGASFIPRSVVLQLAPGATAYREGYVTVTAGNLSKVIKVIQTEATSVQLHNCNIIDSRITAMALPIMPMVNLDFQRITDATVIKAELVWQDAPDLVRDVDLNQDGVYQGAAKDKLIRVKFNTGTFKEGNAVVAIRDVGTGEIVWTWHFWITNYGYQNASNWVVHDGVVFMDRNLGALTNDYTSSESFGNYYQWGRKDPFPGPAALTGVNNTRNSRPIYDLAGNQITFDATSDGVHIASSPASSYEDGVKNPLTVYPPNYSLGGAWGYPWVSSGLHNNYWTLSTGAKNASYDPCPHGWKVVEHNNGTRAYKNLGSQGNFSTYGAEFERDYLPASGNRAGDTGKFWSVGQNGQLWYSNGYQLTFNVPGGSVSHTNGTRGDLKPVRCMRYRTK